MGSLVLNFKRTFSFMKGHYTKYSLGIIGMTVMRCSAALLQAYLLNVFLKAGRHDSILEIFKMFIWLIAYVAIIMLILPIFQFWFNGQAKYGHGNINKAIYHKYGDLKVNYFEKNHSGKILSLILNDTWLIATIFMRHFRRVIAAIITIIVYLIPMFVMDYRITTILLVISIITMFVNVKTAAWVKKITKVSQEKAEDMTVEMSNMITGMSVIRIYNMYSQMKENFKKSNKNVANQELKRARILSGLSAYNHLIYMVNIVLFLIFGSILVANGLSSFANIIAIMSLQTALDANFKELGEYYPHLINSLAASERVFDFLDIDNEKKQYEMERIENAEYIQFKDIDFAYEGNTEKVFEKYNLSIKEGESVALVGESGCGKSTLVKLLLGFYEIGSGAIAVSGKNVADMSVFELRNLISYVPQEPELYNVTIMENIRYGKPGASDEEVMQAAQKANADEFINGLPDGFNTVLGEQGTGLSGGQRQRIAIARALLKDAPIIIFDEATSALDNDTESKINDSISNLKDKTLIIIAHRESAIKNVDRIVRIENIKRI